MQRGPKCVSLVSEYTDCTEENMCSGCTKCICSMDSQWICTAVHQCDGVDDDTVDDDLFDAALLKLDLEKKNQKERENVLMANMESKLNVWKTYQSEILESENENSTYGKNDKSDYQEDFKSQQLQSAQPKNTRMVPRPGAKRGDSEELLEMINSYDPQMRLRELSRRPRAVSKKVTTATTTNENKHSKRSTDKATTKRQTRNSNKENNTIKFYSTVDELNEDTLKNSNISGTLHAKKVELKTLPEISRRSNSLDNNNKSLHIDFNQPKVYNHISDNKIDTSESDNKLDLSHEKLNVILGNHSQKAKDKDLSKLVVNELKPGSEVIGDSNAPVTSNITFTSENDTLTAMAFIAGNLLNKLWNMEKDASGSTLETDDMKHEKISDLLDLFKEPLNLRQETFLKNALERLSSAIDKDRDIKNVTICQTIEDATQLIDNYSEDETPNVVINEMIPCNEDKSPKEEKNKQAATVRAISKINNVLGLLKKFETVQRNLSYLKNDTDFDDKDNSTQPVSKKLVMDSLLTKDEASSLNMFGNIVDRITNLLLPKKNNRKTLDLIRNKHLLSNDKNIKNNFLKMHDIDLSNMTMTAKDKLVLDYLTHISGNPDCALNKNSKHTDTKTLPSIEGNILLNLSEFFKMKSFTDLINLLQPGKEINKSGKDTDKNTKSLRVSDVTPSTTVETTTTTTTTTQKSRKFASTKEKLKAHLKTIIEDLIELQNAKGIAPKGNIRIADALPCIYNIMNAGKEIIRDNNKDNDAHAKIFDIFNDLKIDMKTAKTRRSDAIMPVRPKSAIVLERIIKNAAPKSKSKTRRIAGFKIAKPLDDVVKTIDKLRNISSLYKNQALFSEVPAAERIVLLKALQADVKEYITALEAIKRVYQNSTQFPPDIVAFILESASNISLNAKVINKVEKMDKRKYITDMLGPSDRVSKTTLVKKPLAMLGAGGNNDDSLRISRNQIINHLIRNRMKTFMNLKETKELDVNNDLNYNIAKRVIFYLDSGNINLAHELFKVLVMQKHDTLGNPDMNIQAIRDFADPSSKIPDFPLRPNPLPRMQPLMQFEEPRTPDYQTKWMSQDHLIKQLLNIKNMGV